MICEPCHPNGDAHKFATATLLPLQTDFKTEEAIARLETIWQQGYTESIQRL